MKVLMNLLKRLKYLSLITTPQIQNSISGKVWNDADLDGKIETDESGLQGWKVYLDQNQNLQHDEFEQHTLSDLNGHYSFFDLESGEYNVQIEMRLDLSRHYRL